MVKSIKENPKYNNEKAQKKIRQAVEREPKTIQAKAEIMVEHFDAKIFRSHKLAGKAKAMVMTKDIECAILYHQAICEIIEKKKLPYHALIAFSGEKTLGGKKFTEAGINGFSENETTDEFDNDDNRILVVANKYLTGFDQPKLCAMYIDKPLANVLAVQALSRLNRSAPELGKKGEDLFVLDFFNTADDMKSAFEPYYTATTLNGSTDVNILHDLQATLLSVGVFDMDDVKQFADLYFHGAEASELSPIIDTCAERFNQELEWGENGKADFKMKCKQFVKVYSRMAAIMLYNNAEWECLFWFLRLLIPGLKVTSQENDSLKDLLDSVDLSTYGARRTTLNQHIELDSGETVIDPLKPTMVNAGDDDGNKDPLDKIVKEFNDHYFKGWDATPEEQRAKLINLTKQVLADEDYQLVEGNPDEQAVTQMMQEIIARQIRKMRKGDNSFYSEDKGNGSFQYGVMQAVNGIIANRDHIRV